MLPTAVFTADSEANVIKSKILIPYVPKDHAVVLLKASCAKKKTGVIATGAMSDPYNPFEKKYELTRCALKIVDEMHFGIAIDTKSDLICRDIDLLEKIKNILPYSTITYAISFKNYS